MRAFHVWCVMPAQVRAVSQLPWPHQDREEWFSLGENHERCCCFGLHQLRNRRRRKLGFGGDALLGLTAGIAVTAAFGQAHAPPAVAQPAAAKTERVEFEVASV